MSSRCSALSLTLALVSVLPSFAQSGRASLTGTVFDPQGRRVADAQIKAINNATGLERVATSTSSGTYILDDLPIGRYTVSFNENGFGEFKAENVREVIGQTRTLDAHLPLRKGVTATTVSEPLVQLNKTNAVLGAPIEQAQINYLPLNGRNWSSLTTLVPGAIDAGASDQRTIRFAGRGLDDNNFLFDGVDFSGILNQAQREYVRLAIPTGSISEFQVQSAAFTAEIGQTAGGQVAAASSAGTNNFHGGAFEFFRSDVFDARSPFDGSSPAPFTLNQFGASVGGPIVANKTFFFANYEGLRQHLGQTQIGLVPSPAFLAAGLNSPASRTLLGAFPTGTSPSAKQDVFNYVAGALQVDNEDSGMVRLDQHFTPKTTAYVRFNADEAVNSVPTGALNVTTDADTRLRNGVAELLHVFSPTVVNELKFGVNQDIYHTANLSPLPYTLSVTGFSSLNSSRTTDGYGTNYSWVDDLTWVKGRHILKFGVEIRRYLLNQGSSQDGSITYNSTSAFLSNAINRATITGLLPLKRLRKTSTYGYVQDEWKVTSNLTLNLGLRYNFFNSWHEVDNRAIPFDFATCGGYCAPGSDFSFPRHNDLDPRVALAWAHHDTVFRVGGGIYHSDAQLEDSNLPEANDIQRYTLTAQGFPGLSFPISPFLANAPGTVTPRLLDRRRKDEYVSQWTASVQQALPGHVVGTATYLGSKGTDLITTSYVNTINPLTGLRPYPNFGIVEYRGNQSNSIFNALQLNARRAFQHGLLLSANYMWSHSIDDGSLGGGEAIFPENVACRACERASSDQDVRQVFNASLVYDLPFGKERRFLTDGGITGAVLGGWQFSTVVSARTGLPGTVTVDRLATELPDGNVSSPQRPNVVAGVSVVPTSGQSLNGWINPAAFAVPAPGTWGNAGRNLIRGPNLAQMDAALSRTFTITERLGLEARAEAFNVFNRAQYGNPLVDLSNGLNFGQITTPVNQGATGSGTPRQFQFALRVQF